jgi:hypothetical protein
VAGRGSLGPLGVALDPGTGTAPAAQPYRYERRPSAIRRVSGRSASAISSTVPVTASAAWRKPDRPAAEAVPAGL